MSVNTNLRYLTIKTHVTAETVHAYANENQLRLMDAKALLEKSTATVLQYWDGHLMDWVAVPHVTEYRSADAAAAK